MYIWSSSFYYSELVFFLKKGVFSVHLEETGKKPEDIFRQRTGGKKEKEVRTILTAQQHYSVLQSQFVVYS